MEKGTKGNEEVASSSGTSTVKTGVLAFKGSFYGHNRESHDGLVELEAELRRAYAAKALRAQVMAREAERFVESTRKRQIAEVTRLAQQVAMEEDHHRRMLDQERSERYREQLEEQIALRDEDRQVRMVEARREREVLREVDRIREERERASYLERKTDLADRMQRERLLFQEMRVIRKQEEREKEEEERVRGLEYSKELEDRANEIKRLRSECNSRRDKVVQEIATMFVDVEAKKLEREALLTEIVAEEIRIEMALREREEKLKRERMSKELVACLEEQIVFTEQCKMKFVEQDRAFGEEIMKKVMEDEKMTRLTLEARRRAQIQYREDLYRLIEERKRVREQEMIRIERAIKEDERNERERLQRVKEERKRLLAEHAPNVVDYIKKVNLSEEEHAILEDVLKSNNPANIEGNKSNKF